MENKRKDLLEVAHDQWKASKIDINQIKQSREDFNTRMFGNGKIKEDKPQRKKVDYIKNDLNRLENNMNREYDIYKANKVNDFLNKFRDK